MYCFKVYSINLNDILWNYANLKFKNMQNSIHDKNSTNTKICFHSKILVRQEINNRNQLKYKRVFELPWEGAIFHFDSHTSHAHHLRESKGWLWGVNEKIFPAVLIFLTHIFSIQIFSSEREFKKALVCHDVNMKGHQRHVRECKNSFCVEFKNMLTETDGEISIKAGNCSWRVAANVSRFIADKFLHEHLRVLVRLDIN